jgi:hypothetical protein
MIYIKKTNSGLVYLTEYRIGFITRFSKYKSRGGFYKDLDTIIIFYIIVWKYFIEIGFLKEPENLAGPVMDNFYI